MADDELSKKLPVWVSGMTWPQAFEHKGRLHIGGIGSAQNYVPTPRDRLVDYLNRSFYGDNHEGRTRAENIMKYLDVTHVAIPNAAYNTARAIGEGRYVDAIIPGITAAAPFLGKPTRMVADAMWGKRKTGDLIGDLPKSRPNESTPEVDIPGVDHVREYPLFAPPDKTQRPFDADYNNGVKNDEVDAAGSLLVDMDGDPFIAKYKVGRLTKGGDDVGLTPEQYKALAEDIIEKKIETVPRAEIGGSSGRLSYDPSSKKPESLLLADDIRKRKRRDLVLGHEGGHALHVASGLKPLEPEMMPEVTRNYSTLATGDEYRKQLVLPSSRGYAGEKIEHELIGEAFRAAVTNPNYMKTAAPKTYATLRKWIKSNPELAKLIQLNGLAAATTVGLGMAGQSEESLAGEFPQQHSTEVDQPKGAQSNFGAKREIAGALLKRGPSFQLPKTGKFNGIVRALLALETRQKTPSYGGPR